MEGSTEFAVPDGSAEPSDSAPQSMESFSGDVRSIFFYNCEAQERSILFLHAISCVAPLLVFLRMRPRASK
eukprot:2000813-Pleurochrysis_carterae.AAC.2